MELRDAAAMVSGAVISIQPNVEFGTTKVDGVRVLIDAGDGFAQVKLKQEHADNVRPTVGQYVAWWLRYGALERETGGLSKFSAFVSVVSPEDFNRIAGSLTPAKAA